MTRWLAAFVLTQIVEAPIYVHALREGGSERAPARRRMAATIAVALGASALTHPIVWFVMPELVPGPWLRMVLIAELFAIVAEALWLRSFGLRRAMAWAALANASSVLVGLVLRHLTGWP